MLLTPQILVTDSMVDSHHATGTADTGDRLHGWLPSCYWHGRYWWQTPWLTPIILLAWQILVTDSMVDLHHGTGTANTGDRLHGRPPSCYWHHRYWWQTPWLTSIMLVARQILVTDSMVNFHYATGMADTGDRLHGGLPSCYWHHIYWWQTPWSRPIMLLAWQILVTDSMVDPHHTTGHHK